MSPVERPSQSAKGVGFIRQTIRNWRLQTKLALVICAVLTVGGALLARTIHLRETRQHIDHETLHWSDTARG